MSAAALFEISTLLNTGLDKPTLAVLVELIGIPPVPPPRDPTQATPISSLYFVTFRNDTLRKSSLARGSRSRH